MTDFRIEQIASQRMQQEQRQILRMEQADLLEVPEEEFQKFIAEVERSPLFRKFYQQDRLIQRQRFPRTDVAAGVLELKEELVASSGSADVESLLEHKTAAIQKIRKLGLDKFKQYFLFPEMGMTPEEIALDCGIPVVEVGEINELVDDLSIMSEFYHPSGLSSGAVHYSRIASVDRDRQGFVLGYFSPLFARGRYVIDYQKFEDLRSSGAVTESEAQEARRLFKKLELINSRKNTVTGILREIVEHQKLYLESGKAQSLLPFSQKELAEKLGVAPSSVSRAIGGKSIDTPWHEEVPLKNFFPKPRRFKRDLLKQLLVAEKDLTSDEEIRERLMEKFGVAISRRSVANLRRELKIPAGHGRAAQQVKEAR